MIKVSDVAFVRFRVPDLDRAAEFAEAFGLVTAEREGDRLYSRGSDPSPWIHLFEQGEAGFAGVGFDVATAEEFEAAAQLPGASAIEPLDGPGGGQRVSFTDPDGYSVEVVHGREPAASLPAPHAQPYNTGHERRRLNVLQRVEKGPARVKRLGHCVVRVSDFQTSSDWYRSRFGFIPSDEVYLGDPSNVITAFLRCDRGDMPVDHHTFLCVGVGEPGFDHAAFEVEDIDAVMLGNEHLEAAGFSHHAGIGRHVLGSQVFDYWQDPWGHVHEHFTDGDLLDAGVKTGSFDPATALGTQWGKFGPA
ncbi:MAG: VOC family protein [Myxococcales bacterium]|nr:VOC family protein [Myxococcales bacterium]